MTYKVQIDNVVRNANAEEAALIEAQQAEAEVQAEAQAAKVSAREALLTRLGITADEAQLLLGA
jgi:hypothetical protein